MNIKMATNSQLSTAESEKNKNKLSKQLEWELNCRYGDHLEGYQLEVGRGRMGGKVKGLRIINW